MLFYILLLKNYVFFPNWCWINFLSPVSSINLIVMLKILTCFPFFFCKYLKLVSPCQQNECALTFLKITLFLTLCCYCLNLIRTCFSNTNCRRGHHHHHHRYLLLNKNIDPILLFHDFTTHYSFFHPIFASCIALFLIESALLIHEDL